MATVMSTDLSVVSLLSRALVSQPGMILPQRAHGQLQFNDHN